LPVAVRGRALAYVGPWERRTGEFWNAPFGALCTLDTAADTDVLVTRRVAARADL